MKAVADTLAVTRSNLIERMSRVRPTFNRSSLSRRGAAGHCISHSTPSSTSTKRSEFEQVFFAFTAQSVQQ